jgi:hypothetical protein
MAPRMLQSMAFPCESFALIVPEEVQLESFQPNPSTRSADSSEMG